MLILSNKNSILYYLLGLVIDLGRMLLIYEQKWMILAGLPAMLLVNIFITKTSSPINQMICNYLMIILEVASIAGYSYSMNLGLNISSSIWLGILGSLTLKLLMKLRWVSKKVHGLKEPLFVKNLYLEQALSPALKTSSLEEAETVIIEQAEECTAPMAKKRIISLDSPSDLIARYIPEQKEVLISTDLKYMNIVVITNDEDLLVNCKALLPNCTIVTDSEYLSKKHDCQWYNKGCNLDQDIVIDFYMLNMHNLHTYSLIMQEIYRPTKTQKILLSASRYSACIDLLVPNLLKEALWLNLAEKQPHNIILPVRFGDIISDQQFGLFNEINYIRDVVVNEQVLCSSKPQMLTNTIHLLERLADLKEVNGVYRFAQEASAIKPIMDIKGYSHIEYQSLWLKLNQTTKEEGDLFIYHFPWLGKSLPILERFVQTGEFNAMDLLSLTFDV